MSVSSPLKWHGGKTYLAKWIISHFPPHKRYVEPFFGGGSVMLAKDPSYTAEFANDIYGHLINFWRVLGNRDLFGQFRRKIEHVPLCEEWFYCSLEEMMHGTNAMNEPLSEVCQAVNFFIVNRMSRQGLGKNYCTPTSRTRRGMNENVSAWLSAVDGLPEVHERLRRVEIWNRDVLEVIDKLDSPDTLFYLDPPYVHETRQAKDAYKHEMSTEEHDDMLMALGQIKGKFVLSGYPCFQYDAFSAGLGWHISDRETPLHSSSKATKEKKIERLWMNFEPDAPKS